MPLYKGKGAHTECSNYRPISLLSVPGKVFAHVILTWIQPSLRRQRRPQQSGFTAGRSTMDAILALRLLAEQHHAFNRPLQVAYIDVKAAFDSVDRASLWKTLQGSGIPPLLLHLIHRNNSQSPYTDWFLCSISHDIWRQTRMHLIYSATPPTGLSRSALTQE